MIKAVKKSVDIPLIVGGGIRNDEQAKVAVAAGADILVTGNIIEEVEGKRSFKRLIEAVRESAR